MEIDKHTIKALAADTRLDILKSLTYRRKTPSELSKELNLATSTVVEHLNKLEKVGLVEREETGHKWIYYDLTEKGSKLIKPKFPIQIVLVLSLTIFIVFAGFMIYYYSNYSFDGTTYIPPSSIGEGASLPQRTTEPQKTGLPVATGGALNISNTTNTTNTTQP